MRTNPKRLLIYGKLFTVYLDGVLTNDDVVREVRTMLTDQEDDYVDFGLIVNSGKQLSLLFLYDWEDDTIECESGAVSNFSRFLTGDGRSGFKLKYPVWRKKDTSITIERLTELYRKNNRYFGGDEIKDLVMDASPTMLKIDITFKDDEI